MPAPQASFARPESLEAAEALARTPGTSPRTILIPIALLGLVLTGLATWAVVRVDNSTEERLLQGQTRQAATVLSTAIGGIQQPMLTTLDGLSLAEDRNFDKVFRHLFGREVGPDALFLTASLWRDRNDGLHRFATLGARPALSETGPETRAILDKALTTQGVVVRRVEVDSQLRIAYSVADRDGGWIIYAERAIPADRRAPVDRDSAFSELHYAIYLGRSIDTADLTTTDVDPDSLPLDGLTYRTTVPFGDNVLTLTTSRRTHLGSRLSEWLPVMIMGGGLLLTLIAGLVALKLERSRSRAEHDTRTITTLYQRVDSLYGEQRELFVRLQRALLPQANPVVPGIEFGAEYVAGARGIDIGGDWYSVIGIGDGRFAFVVGDVSGNGVDAVAEMARARFTLRAYLVEGHSPSESLEMCSRQFDVTTDGHIVTALVGVGNRDTGELVLAIAGHPMPLLATSDSADFVSGPVGRPLGAGPSSYDSFTVTMPPGSTLLCFTDGLIERRGESIDDGMHRLAGTVSENIGQPLDTLIGTVIDAQRHSGSSDDIAVLALRRIGRRTRLAADEEAPAAARAFVREQLEGSSLPGGVQLDDVVLSTSELVTNAVRAGSGYVDLELELRPGRLDLSVEDDADGWPEMGTPSADAPGGRGLSIVNTLSDSFDVVRTTEGKRVSVTWRDQEPIRPTG